ncbi:serine/threonine-protein kinase [Streptomyces sp. NPDC048172]|uniref:serine/threonine-protein kinase n=1 Tax=Streptomyces sp. NPDC048172 TaxID=3365505 RepID=UPI0037224797
MADLAPDDPAEIGGYRLLSRLGTGGMGRVYLARSEGGRTVAVKLIKNELAQEELFRTRFRLEVEAARRVGDRWTAPVLDADTEAATPWVATGYIAGPALDQVIAAGHAGQGLGHGPLPADSLRVLAYGLASALLDIHGAGLVHRDLKPSNVLLTIDGPRVIDFGIARALDEVPESTLTSTGMVVGSPSFMSPEQIRSGQVTPASDVFCLGAVLAYAATGRPPFGSGGGAGGVHSVMFRIASEEPDLEGVEEPMRELIADCLAKEPEARPAPEEIVARVQPVSFGASAPPWLPSALIAELGRQAVQLLDTDTPPSGSGGLPPEPAPAPEPAPEPSSARTPDTTGSGAVASAPAPEPVPDPAAAYGHAAYAPEPDTSQVPRFPPPGPDPYGIQGTPPQTPSPNFAQQRYEPAPPPPRRSRRVLVAVGALAAVVVLGGLGFAATGAEVPLIGGKSGGGKEAHTTDVPRAYLGTWSGPVERDGEPTGQYRRFVITKGEVGEVVATSLSLGDKYACESDGKLTARPSASAGLRLDTKVVRSIPANKCSAIGEHTLTEAGDGALKWNAGGRTAVLHKVNGPEKLPREMAGEWQRALPGGGQQKLTVTEDAMDDGKGLTMVSEGSEHCEAKVTVFSAGGDGEDEAVRLTPPDVKRDRSNGACVSGGSSTLTLEGDALVRKFPDGSARRYARLG